MLCFVLLIKIHNSFQSHKYSHHCTSGSYTWGMAGFWLGRLVAAGVEVPPEYHDDEAEVLDDVHAKAATGVCMNIELMNEEPEKWKKPRIKI